MELGTVGTQFYALVGYMVILVWKGIKFLELGTVGTQIQVMVSIYCIQLYNDV